MGLHMSKTGTTDVASAERAIQNQCLPQICPVLSPKSLDWTSVNVQRPLERGKRVQSCNLLAGKQMDNSEPAVLCNPSIFS